MKRENIITSCLILSLFIASFCIILSNSFSNNKNIIQDEELIGTYIDGEYSENIPNKDTGYVVEKIVCDNNAVGKWDYDNWGITLTNLSEKAKCNIHFRKGVKLADTINLVDTTGKCPTVNDDGTVNVTSAESENSLLCSAPDNYGNSYYFRGNVTTNYVKFANFYWRIVRINGDGSIRMIYDGTSAHANVEVSVDRIIGQSAFNEKTDDNAYVGYMYGTPGSSTYEETHANINDSTIKEYIDNWYKVNIYGTNNEKYLADNIFCNDRSFSSENAGNGTGKTLTTYNYGSNYAYSRITFKCSQKNDAFTMNDSVKGNGNLKYPMALLSTSEALLAGAYNDSNNSFYLNCNAWYWVMSPIGYDENGFAGAGAYVRDVYDDGHGNYGGRVDNAPGGVKPIINLKPNSLKSGDGTINNPYTVE